MELLLQINNLKKEYLIRNHSIWQMKKEFFTAVKDINFTLGQEELLAIVGESGSGKSTIARLIMNLTEPTEGEIIFDGMNIVNNYGLNERRNIQMIFQDPYSSLNPRIKVGDSIAEPYLIHKMLDRNQAKEEAEKLLIKVGLSKDDYYKYPHEFSGGQRQRIAIARALTLKPKVLICDECVSALDVTIQKEIIDLLITIKKEYKMSLIFISHDLKMVEKIADYVIVMQNGQIVESNQTKELFMTPKEEYTRKLLSAVLEANPRKRKYYEE